MAIAPPPSDIPSGPRPRGTPETHHGLWAIGVKVFTVMSFKGKSSLIAFAFLVPAIVLGSLLVPEKIATMQHTAQERVGLAYANEAVRLLHLAQDFRAVALHQAAHQAGGDLNQARQALQAQLDRLSKMDAQEGGELGTTPHLAQARAQLQQVASPDEGLLKVYASNAKFIESLYTLIESAADGGSLTLDPDLDAASLADGVVLLMPMVVDEASRMGSLAAATAAAGQGGNIAALELNRLDTLVEESTRKLSQAISKVISLRPQTQSLLDIQPVAKAIDALRDESTDAPGEGGLSKASKLGTLSAQALTSAWHMQGNAMSLLDDMLAARERRIRLGLVWVGAAVLGSLLVAAYMLYAFFLVMNGSLAEARRHLDRMAEGDLTNTPATWGKGDSSDLLASLMRMQTALVDIVSGVRGSAEQIASASSEIAQGVMDISSRTERTANNLDRSAVAIHEIAETASETAEVVHQVAGLAKDSAGVAGEGGQIVKSMVSQMAEINASSQQITDITAVIDSIAFQTNILALNAAVEAARAGEQGRGFAVVAGEVRILAQRSSSAAREIKTLIGSSVDHVEAGAKVAHRAGETMAQIVNKADRVCALMGTIASGSQNQRQRVGEVSGTVKDINAATHQNATLSEQAVAATEALRAQSAELLARVARFQLPGTTGS